MSRKKATFTDYDEMVGTLSAMREEIRNRARDIRNCLDCTEGFAAGRTKHIGETLYPTVKRCSCWPPYADAARTFNRALVEYEQNPQTWWTSDMTYLSTISRSNRPSPEQIEGARKAIKQMMDGTFKPIEGLKQQGTGELDDGCPF